MKKILTVLIMTLMMAGSLFAKPVNIEKKYYYILTDDEITQKDFGDLSDADIISLVVSSFPKKIGEYEYKYTGFSFEEVDELSEKYFNYFIVYKNNSRMLLVQNLGDGRQLTVMFKRK